MQLRKLTSEALVVFSGQTLSIAASLLLIKYATDIFDAAPLGKALLATTITGLSGQLITGGVGAGLQKQFASARETNALWAFRQSANLVIAMATCCASITTVLLSLLALYFHVLDSYITVLLLGTHAITSSLNSLHLGLFAAARMRMTVAISSVIESGSRVVILPIIASYFGATSQSFLLAFLIPGLVLSIPLLMRWRRHLSRIQIPEIATEARSGDFVKQVLHFAWPYTTWGILTSVQQVSDRWSLEMFCSSADIAIYAIAFQIGYSPIVILTNIGSTFITPIFFQLGSRSSDATLQRLHSLSSKFCILILVTTLLGSAGFSLINTLLKNSILDSRYNDSLSIVYILIASGGLFAIGQMLTITILSVSTSRAILAPKIGTAVTGIAFNIIGAYLGGPVGVAYGSLAFSVTYALWMVIITRKSGTQAQPSSRVPITTF
ncbi:Polysaccharide biosynthesis protein [Pirellula sp. SH-Sr6A]|uniref:lipopolysaccharide biosynthesis protein n=1 Tax=Pirellula sp. SH-Sr6A TaxID=1632865 RepID=UPI00078BFF07|nr:oligosaccharide flippase family protein [Pirellula sp. SH-Sr6A]AMV31831.1 Polysaccharide biosynthesis protein [Pirellula sp. SH-Sr6A]